MEIENLKALVYGRELSLYQRKLAIAEFERMVKLGEELNIITSVNSINTIFNGRDEKDSKVIEEAKRLWAEKPHGKLNAVKHMMKNGWELRVAFEYCKKNF